MKRLFACICCCVLVFVFCACEPKAQVDQEALAPFVGEWDCQESTLEERGDEEYRYVGYLDLRVEEDGTFSMYDAEAGNPGMAGKMYPDTEGTVKLDCEKDDFDPPFCWLDISTDGELSYQFLTEDGTEFLHLSYTGDNQETSTLVFERWK